MPTVSPEQYLKKPGRVLTWHAGAHCRSHKSSMREDYFTVLPKELAGFLHLIDSDTTEGDVLEMFLEEMLLELFRLETEYEELHRGDPMVPPMPSGVVLFEIRGYFRRHLEFAVTQHALPPSDPFRRGPEPRWLLLANQNVRDPHRCGRVFDDFLNRCARVASAHSLQLDLTLVRDGFRTMLRRRAMETAPAPAMRWNGGASWPPAPGFDCTSF